VVTASWLVKMALLDLNVDKIFDETDVSIRSDVLRMIVEV
jgi:hypothetical protein